MIDYDYREMITKLRDEASVNVNYKRTAYLQSVLSDAATAIETLLANRTDELNNAWKQGYDAAKMEVQE